MGADPTQHSAYVAVTAKRSDDWVHLASRVLEENIRGRYFPCKYECYLRQARHCNLNSCYFQCFHHSADLLTRADVAYRCQCIRCYRGQAYTGGSFTSASEIGTPTARLPGGTMWPAGTHPVGEVAHGLSVRVILPDRDDQMLLLPNTMFDKMLSNLWLSSAQEAVPHGATQALSRPRSC